MSYRDSLAAHLAGPRLRNLVLRGVSGRLLYDPRVPLLVSH